MQMDKEDKELGDVVSVSKTKRAGRKQLRELVESQQYRCALSGMKLTPENAELDHKLAVVNGVDHSIGNLQVLHVQINRMKATIGNDEFIRLCKLIASWNS